MVSLISRKEQEVGVASEIACFFGCVQEEAIHMNVVVQNTGK